MAQRMHEIWDPIHSFVHFTNHEREVMDSRPFQRLRHIHQLGMTHFLYPSANHTRFEHSIGVMDLATRVFDVVTDPDEPDRIPDELRDPELLPELVKDKERRYWRRVLRMAALCHDLGHLPFSHSGEEELFPDGWSHERMTIQFIRDMSDLWQQVPDDEGSPLEAEHIAKIAVGQKHYPDGRLTDGEAILSEIITGNYFGVDRMDYLLRDSLHVGVASGTFDHHRLVETLRVLREPPDRPHAGKSLTPTLGVEAGGLWAAEALLTARHFMFKQVYFHPVRRIYDIHLQEFTSEFVGGAFPVDTDRFLEHTDETIMNEMLAAVHDRRCRLTELARRVVCREHFRLAYRPAPADLDASLSPAQDVFEGLCHQYPDDDLVRGEFPRREERKKARDEKDDAPSPDTFSVWDGDEVQSSGALSKLIAFLTKSAHVEPDFIFVRRDRLQEVKEWVKANKERAFAGEWRSEENEPA